MHEAMQRLFDQATAPPEAFTEAHAESTQRTWDELRAYTDFVLTLLAFFADKEKFPDQHAFTDVGYDGMLQRLAEARLELAVSPAGAQLLLSRFRAAWGLPHVPRDTAA